MLKFTKMNGAGNDFVMIDGRTVAQMPSAAEIAHLCDRHRGIGADGVLMVEPAREGADFRMRYFNADGGEAEMCGNGARCFARFANRISGKSGPVRFETLAGVIRAECVADAVQITMSAPRDLQLRLSLEGLAVHAINTGVPHAITFVDDLENAPVRELGPTLRYHAHFAPKGTNVNFAQKIAPQEIAIRTYERGVEAETLACGTGVVASALVHHALTGAPSPIGVRVRGGERLEVAFISGGELYQNVTLTGPADFVFDGEIEMGVAPL